MLLTQSVRRLAQINGNGLATVDGTESRNWREVNERISRLAGGLVSVRIGAGDRVGVLALNSARYMEVYFATLWVGGVVVPLNTRWSFEELVYGLTDSEPDLVFIDTAHLHHLDDLRARCGKPGNVILMDGTPRQIPGVLDYETLISQSVPFEPVPQSPETTGVICYTGGTSGLAKGVMLSHLAIWSSSMAMCVDYGFASGERTTFLHALPLFHSGGLALLFAVTIAGGSHVFLQGFDAGRVLRTIEERKITHVLLVPTMVRMLLDGPDFADHDLSSLRKLNYGAAPMSAAQIEETMARLPGVDLQQGYGLTELAPYISSLRPRDHIAGGDGASRLSSAGHAGACSEVSIRDAGMREMPPGEIGEVCVRGPHMMTGYWRKPEETKTTIVDGWVRTGDAGYLDEGGYLFLVDRIKDMIVTGGENVYSSEVENVIARHPSVAAAVVIGIPDSKWGEAVHAIVMLREGLTASQDEIAAHCRSHIAGYKCPRSVEFRSEPFPVSGAGKILKREIRKP